MYTGHLLQGFETGTNTEERPEIGYGNPTTAECLGEDLSTVSRLRMVEAMKSNGLPWLVQAGVPHPFNVPAKESQKLNIRLTTTCDRLPV